MTALLGTAAVVLTMTTVSVSSAAAGAEAPATWGENQVTNGSFESGPEGWRTNGTLTVGNGGTDGDRRAALTTSKRRVSLHDAGTSATGADALSTWRATAWLRSTDPSVSGRITVVQRSGNTTVLHAQEFRLPDRKWQQVQLDLVVTEGDSSLDLRLHAGPIRGNDAMLLVDDVRLQQEVVVEPTPTPTPALTPEPSALDLVGSNGSNANRLDHSVKVPSSVQPGDALLLHWAANNNNGTVTPPSGWTKVTGTDRDGVRGGVWLRTAKVGDAGSAVTIKTANYAKSDVGVTAYRDAHEAPIDAWKAAVQTTTGSSHQAPAVTSSYAGSWVVTYVAAKSSVDNSLKVPAGLTGRRTSTGTGGGRITAVLADSAASVEAGVAQGPFTFEGTARSSRAVMYSLALRRGASVPQPEPQPQPNTLTNGCAYNARGVPASCGAYFGGATGSNTDPSILEAELGRKLGTRRTYWRADQVSSAVSVAKADLAKGRLPWMSFKLPHNWTDMTAGQGDAWVRDVVDRLDALDGPVWLAFHHEPENDGDAAAMRQWKAMQEHLGPIVRNRSDSVAFTVILMGWHELYGKDYLRFDAIWPNTEVDVAGFDVYNWQGTPSSSGGIRTKPVDMETEYFVKLEAWAKKAGVAWGLAETGYTTWSAQTDKTWIQVTYEQLLKHDGVSFSYFNTPLNSNADWTLSTPSKLADYKAALKTSPTLR